MKNYASRGLYHERFMRNHEPPHYRSDVETVSEDCNLACDYCYYSTCAEKTGAKIKRIERNLLEKFI